MSEKWRRLEKELNMLRSLYSAVSGMKSHQTRLDVIGNNIANVNTYGFKSSRSRFQDVFYQTLSSATAGSATKGGTNASQVGYGAQLGGIDLNMTRSAFQSTDNALDLAIAGEGFFQVMDADGNVYYTRAGVLNIDPNGNLIDANGNIVLGVSGDPLGKGPSSDRIQLTVPDVEPTRATVSETINDIVFTITAENTTDAGNVIINFLKDTSLPDGSDVVVRADEITSTSITVRVNETAVFTDLDDLSAKMNAAISTAKKGAHPAGNFTISAEPDDNLFPQGGLTGAEICGTNYHIKEGSVKLPQASESKGIFGRMKPKSVSVDPPFTGSGAVTFDAVYHEAANNNLANWTITATVGGKTYTGVVTSNSTTAKTVLLKNDVDGDYIEMSHPGFDALTSAWHKDDAANTGDPQDGASFKQVTGGSASPSTESNDIGLKSFKLALGNVGGPQTIGSCSIAITASGVIEATHPNLGSWQMGRIDLVTFENPAGLEEVGSSYFAATANSGAATSAAPGTGGTGALKGSALEMSNVDISTEFSDMIVTERGFQANSRIITVSDEILNELINLKR